MNRICLVHFFFFPSCKFSEDGQQLLAILETKSFQIYNIHDAMVELLAEEDTILLSALLESTGIGK
jgi:surface polysaccharide O-acyltransferase-like enzyme